MTAKSAPPKGTEFVIITLNAIVPSPTNPRKIFREEDLAELSSSIKERGVINPLLVRRLASGHYELVDGERRFRAATMAGVPSVPCVIKELTDVQVVEIQLIQGLSQKDLTPLEEAHAYKLLNGKHGLDFDDLAVKLSKPKAYIYTRLRLLKLAPAVQKQLADGSLNIAFAVQLTKLEDQAAQVELANRCVRGYIEDVAELKQIIENEYMLDLKSAPWNLADAALCPTVGACAACPKRTQAQAELFGDAGKRDFCLDAECWKTKVKAQGDRLVAQAKKDKQEIVTGAKAKTLLEACRNYSATMVDLDGPVPNWWNRPMPLKQAINGLTFKTTLVVDDKARAHRVASRAEIMKLLPKEAKAQQPDRPKVSEAEKKKREEEKLDIKAEANAAAKAIETIVSDLADAEMQGDFIKAITACMFENCTYEDQLAAQKALKIADANAGAVEMSEFFKWLKKASRDKVVEALIRFAIGTGLEHGSFNATIEHMAGAAGLKLDSLVKEERTLLVESAPVKKPKPAKAAGEPIKLKPTKKKATKKGGK